MISAATGGTVINYSDRFTLSGMTGTFPPNVKAGIQGVTGTSGPAAQNNVNNNAAGADVGDATGVPYTMQTGLTKYAPMQRIPPTKITAKAASAQFPTSQVVIAKTFLPTPKQVTTLTASGTFSVSSMENTVNIPSPNFLNLANSFSGCTGPCANGCHAKVPQPLEGLREKKIRCQSICIYLEQSACKRTFRSSEQCGQGFNSIAGVWTINLGISDRRFV